MTIVFDKGEPHRPSFSMLKNEILHATKAERWVVDPNIANCIEKHAIEFNSLKIKSLVGQPLYRCPIFKCPMMKIGEKPIVHTISDNRVSGINSMPDSAVCFRNHLSRTFKWQTQFPPVTLDT